MTRNSVRVLVEKRIVGGQFLPCKSLARIPLSSHRPRPTVTGHVSCPAGTLKRSFESSLWDECVLTPRSCQLSCRPARLTDSTRRLSIVAAGPSVGVLREANPPSRISLFCKLLSRNKPAFWIRMARQLARVIK